MKFGWIGFHREGLPALQGVLERGYRVEAVLTLRPDLAAKRSGPTDYQDRGEGKEDESVMGRMRESWFDGVKDSTDLFGQLVVNPIDLPPRRTSFSGLLASRCTALVPELFLGQPLAGTVGYSGHGNLLVLRDAAHGQHLPSHQGGSPSENPKKRQKSSSGATKPL